MWSVRLYLEIINFEFSFHHGKTSYSWLAEPKFYALDTTDKIVNQSEIDVNKELNIKTF